MKIRKMGLLAGALTMLLVGSLAQASAIISDGKVKLGVDDLAQLNISGAIPSVSGTREVGMRYLPGGAGTDEYEVTSHGCLCEGWGVAASGVAGYANNSLGTAGLAQVSFVSDATTATVVTDSGNLRVTHSFALSADTDNLYQVVVTIQALADVTNVEYRRTMDWDADPTPFTEYVTIGGTAAATNVLEASNDGFSSSNPLSSICGNFGASCTMGDFTDLGPMDHGANFDFDFGDLLSGEEVEFNIFYGGADSVAGAFAAMGAAAIEVYSLGRSGQDVDGDGLSDSTGALTPTYIFGFSGVGGDPVGTVSEPGTMFLLGAGLLGLGLQRRRRRT